MFVDTQGTWNGVHAVNNPLLEKVYAHTELDGSNADEQQVFF